MSNISPLAYINPEAQIGENCEIGPFCYIDKNVVLGDNNKLMNNVTILYGARIGSGNIFFPGSVISAIPQDLKFRGEETTAEIGDNNKIRENVTINRGTKAKNRTIVGSDNLLMTGVHVAHDANVGNGCVIGNNTAIAGEVIVDDFAIISANVLIHQFCRVGSYSMLGGGTRTSQDIPPYSTVAREPATYCGLNLVGLRRRKFTPQQIEDIHETYRILYNRTFTMEERLAQIREQYPNNPDIDYILRFIKTSKRGIVY